MKTILLNLVVLAFSGNTWSASFEELVGKLDKHNLLQARLNKVRAIQEQAKASGSWGDPMLKVAAMNYPKRSLSRNKSMMTGIQLGISQKIGISGKYGKLEESQQESSKSYFAGTLQLKREFVKTLWSLAIDKELLIGQKQVLKDNLTWVEDNLKVTNRLYSTGKVPQQAVLDIQIRKSELHAQIDKIGYALSALKYRLTSLLDSTEVLDVDLKTIPWDYLKDWKKAGEKFDYKDQQLSHRLQASELNVSAQRRNVIPDITVGVTYTKRNRLDGLGDFVGANISFPLPTSDSRYAVKSAALYQKLEAQSSYRNYRENKPHLLKKIEFQIKDISNQLDIIKRDTLRFAKSSRDVTAKSYSRGGADYVELLRAEIQYQNQLLKKIKLISQLKTKQVDYLFTKGDDLKMGNK